MIRRALAALAAVALYAEPPAMAWSDLAAEVTTEVRLLSGGARRARAHASV